MDWLDDEYRTQSCAVLHSGDGTWSKFWTQTQPGPDVWNMADRPGINPFLQSRLIIWQNYFNSCIHISRAPSLGARDTGRSNRLSTGQTRLRKKVRLCCGGNIDPTRSGPGRTQVGSKHIGILHPAIAATAALLTLPWMGDGRSLPRGTRGRGWWPLVTDDLLRGRQWKPTPGLSLRT